MKRKDIKTILIVVLVLIELVTIFLSVKSFDNRPIENAKEEVNTKRKQFSMYVENDNGEYEEYNSSNLFPEGYSLNLEKSTCVDNTGQEVKGVLSSNGGKVTVTSNKTVFCYVYFDQSSGESIVIKVSTDGVENTLPSYNKYKQELTCKGSDAYFNTKYQRIEISQVSKKSTTCNLNYSKDTTSYTLLSDKVKNVGETITSTNKSGGTDTSYRYTGKTADNYVWFNNELWRIIGLIPVCLEADCGTPNTSLVKIIRNDIIGSLSYDISGSKKSIEWNESAIYKILNNYYFGKIDGTNSGFCRGGYYSTSSNVIGNCDYTGIGISSNTNNYYGRMVKEVYWNTNNCYYTSNSNECYKSETAEQIYSGKVGLMSGSDYGYVYSKTTDLTDIAASGTWLYSNGPEWLLNYDSSGNLLSTVDDKNDDGSVGASDHRESNKFRPVVYLDASVYIISGTGTSVDPYILGM